LGAAPGRAAAVVQIVEQEDVGQKQGGDAQKSFQARETEDGGDQLGRQEGQKETKNKTEDELHQTQGLPCWGSIPWFLSINQFM